MIHRARAGLLLVGAILLSTIAGPAARAQHDEEPVSRYFRIGTAASSGTYFPVGGIIASAISSPLGARPCGRGGICGVPGLIAVAVATQGSVENVRLIAAGKLEAGFCQSDVADAAYRGTGAFAKAPLTDLRAVSMLFPEAIHVVVRADSGIAGVPDLKHRRVSMGEAASGTEVDAEAVLAAFGLKPQDVKAVHLTPGEASDALREGRIDAFFLVAGPPVVTIVALAESVPIRLLAINGPGADALRKMLSFLVPATIPAESYQGVAATSTLGVGAELVVSVSLDAELVYEVTKALWNEDTGKLLAAGHPQGARIMLAHALDGLAVPLHPGAERFYREAGILH